MNLQHKARKRFGQNFLVDQAIIDRIIRSVDAKPEDTLVEIGPGQGALTEHLIRSNCSFSVIEIDRDLIALLQQTYPNLTIHQGDALKFDFAHLSKQAGGAPLRVVGNLPYNISTPLLFHLLEHKACISDMHFMLQKEVVDRLSAVPGQKSYGRLSVMVQYHCQVMPIFTVPPGAFRPAPKVQSAVVRIKPHKTPPYPGCDIEKLSRVVNQCFQQRRKTLRNCLRPLTLETGNEISSVALELRPEQLSVAQFATITNELFPYD